jgi:thiol-disulfide isomerase/thioredoxin
MLLAGAAAAAGIEKFTRPPEPLPAPDIAFTDLQGAAKNLSDFRGRVVLINLWATWCAPCIEEMPSLIRLQEAVGRRDFLVLALSSDRGGARVVGPFVERHGLERLAVHLDPKGTATRALGARGLPTSILVDRAGREVGRMLGAAEWDSPPLLDLVRGVVDAGGEGGIVKTSGRP